MSTLPTFTRRSAFAPLRGLEDLESESERWFGRAFPALESVEGLGWAPSVDLADTESELVLTAELPGVTPDDVEVDVEANSLTIKGEKKEERKTGTKEMRPVH